MRHLFYLHNLPLPDKVAAQKKIMNKIPARLYIYFPYGEISNNTDPTIPLYIYFTDDHLNRYQRKWNKNEST